MKRALKEAGELKQGSETQVSPRAKQVRLLDRSGEMVFIYCIIAFHDSIVYTLCLLKQPLLKF